MLFFVTLDFKALSGLQQQEVLDIGEKEESQVLLLTSKDEKGEISQKIISYDSTVSSYYIACKKTDKPFVTDQCTYSDLPLGTLMVSFAFPLHDKNGKVIGMAGFDLNTASITTMVIKIRPYGIGHAKLITNNYMVIADGENPDKRGSSLAGDERLERITGSFFEANTVAEFVKNSLSGVTDYIVSVEIPISDSGFSWLFESSLLESVLSDKIKENMQGIVLVGVVVLIIAIGVAVLFSSFVGKAINARDHWYKQVLNTINFPISIVNMDRKVQFLNNYAKNFLGIAENEYKNLNYSAVWKKEMFQEGTSSKGLDNLILEDKKISYSKFDDKNWEIHADYIKDCRDKNIGMIEFFNDISSQKKIEKIINAITIMIENVHKSSKQINTAMQDISQSTTEQAASLEEITASIAQTGAQVNNNAENAQQANSISQNANRLAATGQERMYQLEESINGITANAELTRNVINTIDDIAFQTNLLALNAAVEAARAGTYGRGFAVVAEEVRMLAARSAKAAQETAELIDKSNEEIFKGAELSHQTAKVLAEITREFVRVEAIISEIAYASKEQSEGIEQINLGIEQINLGIEQIDQVTQSNTATSEETVGATQALNKQINILIDALNNNNSRQVRSERFITQKEMYLLGVSDKNMRKKGIGRDIPVEL